MITGKMRPLFGPAARRKSSSVFVENIHKADHLLIFDLPNLAHRSAHAFERFTAKDGRPSGHVFGSIKQILFFARMLKKEVGGGIHLAFAVDSENCWRFDLFQDYKSGRNSSLTYNPVPDVANLVLKIPKAITYECPRMEADDIISVLAHSHWIDKKITIVSSDKDMWQLVREARVRVYSNTLKRFVEKADIRKNFCGIDEPEGIPLVKAIFGDPSDSIPPAVPRLQKKTVFALLDSLSKTGRAQPESFLADLKKLKGQFPWASKIIHASVIIARNYKLAKTAKKAPLSSVSGFHKLPDGAYSIDDLVSFLRSFDIKSILNQCELFLE